MLLCCWFFTINWSPFSDERQCCFAVGFCFCFVLFCFVLFWICFVLVLVLFGMVLFVWFCFFFFFFFFFFLLFLKPFLVSKAHNKNCQDGIDRSFDLFEIPRLLDGEDMANPKIDQNSMMTYISYFRQIDPSKVHRGPPPKQAGDDAKVCV